MINVHIISAIEPTSYEVPAKALIAFTPVSATSAQQKIEGKIMSNHINKRNFLQGPQRPEGKFYLDDPQE